MRGQEFNFRSILDPPLYTSFLTQRGSPIPHTPYVLYSTLEDTASTLFGQIKLAVTRKCLLLSCCRFFHTVALRIATKSWDVLGAISSEQGVCVCVRVCAQMICFCARGLLRLSLHFPCASSLHNSLCANAAVCKFLRASFLNAGSLAPACWQKPLGHLYTEQLQFQEQTFNPRGRNCQDFQK